VERGNKDKLKAKRAEIIQCDCGNQYTFGNKVRHLESKIHIKYQNQLCGIIEPTPTNEEKKILEEEKMNKLREQQKKYRQQNSEKIREFKRQHYQKNKEKISQENKKYYEEHKEQIKEHVKKYSEENKDKIKDSNNDRYQKNKERILETQKEIIKCDCGAEIRKSGKAEHLRSKKHSDNIAKIIKPITTSE